MFSAGDEGQSAKLAVASSGISDLLAVVRDAQSKYATDHKNQKTYKWIVKFSKRVSHYGNILDVLVQQAPEYASLAWGAMKVLFVVRIRCYVSSYKQSLTRNRA